MLGYILFSVVILFVLLGKVFGNKKNDVEYINLLKKLEFLCDFNVIIVFIMGILFVVGVVILMVKKILGVEKLIVEVGN